MAMQIKTGSQNTVDAFGILKGADAPMTIKEVAEALGVTPAKVTGGIVSLEKKGVLEKSEVTQGDKTYKAYTVIEPDVEFITEEPKAMSDKAVRVLQFLQKEGEAMTAAEIAKELELVPIAINGVVNGLVKKGFVVREEAEVEMPDGATKSLKFIHLTDEGKAYKF